MANESLVMTAEVRDNFSGTLRKLQNDLKSLSGTSASSTKALNQEWKGVNQQFEGASLHMRRDLIPAMAAGTFIGQNLGTAIGAAATALKNFAQNTSTMANFSKEIGLSTQELSKLQALGKFFGLDPATMQGNLRTFQDFMNRLKNDSGRTISELRSTFGVAGDELAGKLLNADSMKKATEIAFEAIKSTGNEAKARAIAQAVFGNESWATIIRNATPEVLAEISKIQSKIDENKDAADKFNLAMLKFTTTLTNFSQQALTPMLGVTSNLMEKFGDKSIDGFARSIESIDKFAKSLAESFGTVVGWIKQIEEFTSSSGLGALVGMLPKPGGGGAGSAPTVTGTVDHLNRLIGAPPTGPTGPAVAGMVGRLNSVLGTPASASEALKPAKEMAKSSEDVARSNTELKRVNEKTLSLWERFAEFLGMGGGAGGGLGGGGAGGIGGGMGGLGPAGRMGRGGGGAGGGFGGGGGSATTEKRQTAMRAAMQQLKAEGVPERNLKAAAAMLVGQADSESGLNPGAIHDQGTGAGIYGARDDPKAGGDQRRSKMFAWLAQNGYDRNSLEGQMKYMAHEAMTGSRFGPTRNALMNASAATMAADTHTITRNFEAPAFTNDRTGAVLQAFKSLDAAAELKDVNVKGGAAGGGQAADAFSSLANHLQSNLAGFNRVSALRDSFHKSRPGSAHNRGLAMDATLTNPKLAGAAVQQINEHMKAMGLEVGKDVRVLNEYATPSRGATGGHLHIEFANPASADRYRRSMLLQQQQKVERSNQTKIENNGTVKIELHDSLRNHNAKTSTEGLFKDVQTSRGKPMGTAEDLTPLNRASAGF